MKVSDLIALLHALPDRENLDVCVPDYENNQTTDAVRVSVQQVYGTDCLVIEPAYDEDED